MAKVVRVFVVGAGCALALAEGCERSVDDACVGLAAAECEHRSRCFSVLEVTETEEATRCQRDVAAWCSELAGLDGALVSAAAVDACTNAYSSHTCESLVIGAAPAECRFRGRLPNGAACVSGAECQSSLCRPAEDGACGSCGALRELGDLCSKGGSPCAPGLHCGEQSRCTKFAVEGEICGSSALCHPYFWCDGEVCAAPAAAGEPCAEGMTCDALAGLACDPMSGVCAPADPAALPLVTSPACR